MIEKLLKQIKEDKVDNMSTTSFKFKPQKISIVFSAMNS
jgi:hypothetical protein